MGQALAARLGAAPLSSKFESSMTTRGPRVNLVPLTVEHAAELLELRLASDEFLARREPLRRPEFLTIAGQEEDLRDMTVMREARRGYAFGIVVADRMVGRLAVNNIVHGAFQNAYLGYWVGREFGRRGYATEAVQLALAHAFGPLGLHRVQAAVMLDNKASLRVLAKAGFRPEGIARRYLCVDGEWVDHIMFAITAEDPRSPLDRAEGAEQPAIL